MQNTVESAREKRSGDMVDDDEVGAVREERGLSKQHENILRKSVNEGCGYATYEE